MAALRDPRAELLAACESPDGTPPLSALASGTSGPVLIVVNDHTRVSGKEQSIIWLLDALNENGVPDDRVTVLVALGSHGKASDEKLRQTTGPAIDRVEVIQHDPCGAMVDCGATSRGTPVRVNARLEKAGLVILSSAVVHHYFAGFCGGRKMVLPGLSSLETIAANHSLVFEGAGDTGGRHPKVLSGALDGNPVHEDMLEGSRLALGDRPCISVVAVLTPDKEFACFSAGELDESHKRACIFVDAHNVVEIDSPADLVLASAGGYPKDLNFIQSHKGMDNAVKALKPGGTLLYAMGCSDGYGNPAIEEFAPLDLKTIRARLAKNYVVYGQTVYSAKEKALRYRIVVVSRLDPEFLRSLGMVPAAGIEDAIEAIREDISRAQLAYHIPRGDITLPRDSTSPH